MRKWIDIIENNQTKTKDKTDTFTVGVAPDSVGDLATTDQTQKNVTVPGISSTRAKTRRAVNTPMDAASAAHLGNLAASGLQDEISDEEAAMRAGVDMAGATTTDGAVPEPINPENLPSVIRHDMVALGDPEFDPAVFNPEWHQVKHLPGYMQSAIRSMGRAVFSPFTNTPIEDIQVLSTLSNPTDDVKKMMKWVTRNGVRDDAAELRFEEIMPGYAAQTVIYNTEDATFMMVSDQMGKYIYGWPGGRGFQLDTAAAAPRLESAGYNWDNLRELAQKTSTLEHAYRTFMEGPNDPVPFVHDDDKDPTDDSEMDADPTQQQTPPVNAPQSAKPAQGSGQSNSTQGSVAPGSQNAQPTQQTQTPPPMQDRSGLNDAQKAAKMKQDALRAAANKR